jgi:hypothetical protein
MVQLPATTALNQLVSDVSKVAHSKSEQYLNQPQVSSITEVQRFVEFYGRLNCNHKAALRSDLKSGCTAGTGSTSTDAPQRGRNSLGNQAQSASLCLGDNSF